MRKVTIVESSKELTKKESVMMKDTSDCVKLDEACEDGAIFVKPTAYVILEIESDTADDAIYRNIIIIDTDGTKYVTGSESFMNSATDLISDMQDCEEEWSLKIYKLESKNYKGKKFITCSVI